MANLCITTYQCVGNKEQLEELYAVLEMLQHAKDPLVENCRGKLWLGCIINRLGGNWQEIQCRGEVVYFDYDGRSLCMEQDTDWCEQGEFRGFLELRFPGLKVYYLEQEPGFDVFVTNDAAGMYFPERFYLDTCGDRDPMYFETIEQAAKEVRSIVGHPVYPTVEDIQGALDEYVGSQDDGDLFYSFHEFEVVE